MTKRERKYLIGRKWWGKMWNIWTEYHDDKIREQINNRQFNISLIKINEITNEQKEK